MNYFCYDKWLQDLKFIWKAAVIDLKQKKKEKKENHT